VDFFEACKKINIDLDYFLDEKSRYLNTLKEELWENNLIISILEWYNMYDLFTVWNLWIWKDWLIKFIDYNSENQDEEYY